MNTTNSRRERAAQPGAYRAEFGRTQAGSLTIQIRPQGAKGTHSHHRVLAALLYELAAELELRSRRLDAHWVISPDTANGLLVVELMEDDELPHATEMAEHALASLHITKGGVR